MKYKKFTLIELIVSIFISAVFGIILFIMLFQFTNKYKEYERFIILKNDFESFIKDITLDNLIWWTIISWFDNKLILQKKFYSINDNNIYSWFLIKAIVCSAGSGIYITSNFINTFPYDDYSEINFTTKFKKYPNINCNYLWFDFTWKKIILDFSFFDKKDKIYIKFN